MNILKRALFNPYVAFGFILIVVLAFGIIFGGEKGFGNGLCY